MTNTRAKSLMDLFPPDIEQSAIRASVQLASGLHKHEGESWLLVHHNELVLLTRDADHEFFRRVPPLPGHQARVEHAPPYWKLWFPTTVGERVVLAAEADVPKIRQMIAACPPASPDAQRPPMPTPTPTRTPQPPKPWKQPSWARPGSTGRTTRNKMAAAPSATDSHPRTPQTTAPRPVVGAAPQQTTRRPQPTQPTRPPDLTPAQPTPAATKRRRRARAATFPVLPTTAEDRAEKKEGGLRNQLVLVAAIPKAKLKLQSEERWLKENAKFGRGVTVAGQFFISNVQATSAPEADALAASFRDVLHQRYGAESTITWAPYTEDASLSPNALPPVAQGLIHYLMTHNK